MFWKPAAFTDPKIQYDRNYLLLSWQSDNFWTVWSQLQSFLWNREHQRQFLEYYVYFIVLQPVTCDMKPRKITDKPLQGSVMTWYEATTWPFLLQESVFLLYLSGKKLHNIIFYQKPTLVTWFCLFEIKLPNWPKSECKLWKFTMVQVCIIGKGSSAAKKYGSKTMHQSQPTSMTFWIGAHV